MKPQARTIEPLLRAPPPDLRAVLLYGPDAGLVSERAARLLTAVVPGGDDPFRIAELRPAEVEADSARLNDEVAALALTGGRRVVRIRAAGDRLAKTLAAHLAGAGGAALVVVEADELGPRSSLRRLFEQAGDAAAIPCYPDEGPALAALIRATLQAQGCTPEDDAIAYLVACLGADRQVTLRELEKLALYAGPGAAITLDDARACIDDGMARSAEDVAFAAAAGDHGALDRAAQRLFAEGAGAVAMLRGVGRHFLRLQLVAGRVAAGEPAEQAISGLRPPVFFKRRDAFLRQMGAWPAPQVGRALAGLVEAELRVKSTGIPDEAAALQALHHIAAMARGANTPRRAPR